MRERDVAMAKLTEDQFGAVSCRQARAIGLSREARANRLGWGDWHSATPRVLVRAGAPPCFELNATIALLDAGCLAALSQDTAAASWGVPGFERTPIHVSRVRRSRAPAPVGVQHHHPRLLPEHHLVKLNGLIVTTPTRTLADLAGHIHPKRWERAVNYMWTRGLTDRSRLVRMEQEWCERGRRGSAAIHEYLLRLPIDWIPPASNNEARFIDLIESAGLPRPVSQRDVGNSERWLGRVDCLDPEFALIAEIDSVLFHAAPLDAASDEARDKAMYEAGFRIERFSEFEIWHRGDLVVARWRSARTEMRQRREG